MQYLYTKPTERNQKMPKTNGAIRIYFDELGDSLNIPITIKRMLSIPIKPYYSPPGQTLKNDFGTFWGCAFTTFSAMVPTGAINQ